MNRVLDCGGKRSATPLSHESFLKQRRRKLLRVERLQVVRLFAEAGLKIRFQSNDARSSSNPVRISERIFPSSVAQASSW